MPSLLKRCQKDGVKLNELEVNKTRIECLNKNETIYIKKAEISSGEECNKSLLPSLYLSQL